MTASARLRSLARALGDAMLAGGLGPSDAVTAIWETRSAAAQVYDVERERLGAPPALFSKVLEVYEALLAALRADLRRSLGEEALADAHAALGSLAEEVARLEGEPEPAGLPG